jgi:hypothetical protein
MSESHENNLKNLIEIRLVRQQAQSLRDQLAAEYLRLKEDYIDHHQTQSIDSKRHEQGQEAMRKAITASDRAIASIDQALKEMEQIKD